MRAILRPLRLFGGVLRLGTRAAVLTTFLIMLAFNIATMTIPAVATAVSAAAGAVGITTVAARRAAALAAERARSAAQAATIRSQRSALGAAQRSAASRAAIIRGQRNALRDTAARVSARLAAGATRSVSTSFGQSIPVAGAAVVAGVTVWELHDACETMKDLAALEAEVDDGLKADPELALTIVGADAADVQPAAGGPADANTVCGLSVPSTEEIWNRVRTQPAEIWREMRGRGLALPDWSADLAVANLGGWAGAVRGWWDDDAGIPAQMPVEGTQ